MNKRHLTIAVFLASLFAVLAGGGDALAKDSSRLLKRKADGYFSKGEVMFESGEYEKAAAAFVLAYETYPLPAVLANIGLSYDKAGNIPKAVETLRFYVSQVSEDEVQKWVPGRLDFLEKQIGELIVECPSKKCSVYVDDTEYRDRMKPLILVPGKHLVEAFEGRRLIEKTRANVRAGAMVRVVVGGAAEETDDSMFSDDDELEAGYDEPVDDIGDTEEMDFTNNGAATGDDEAETAPRRKFKMILKAPFWISAGLTVVSTGMTIGFGVATNKKEAAYQKEEDPIIKDALGKTGRKYKIGTNVMIGLTMASAVAAVIFGVIDGVRAKKKSEAEEAADEQVKLQPLLGPGGLGLLGTF